MENMGSTMKIPQMLQALDRLESQIDLTAKELETLFNRLDPIVSPVTMPNSLDTKDCAPPDVCAPFTGRLRSLTNRLIRINSDIEGITSRLEV